MAVTSTLLSHTIVSAFERSGRINGLKLGDELGMSTREMAAALNTSPQNLRKYPAAVSLQTDLTRVMHIAQRLKHLFDDRMDDVRIWLRAPRPQLDKETPMDLLTHRRFKGLEWLISAMEHGLP